MYIPKQFLEEDQDVLLKTIEALQMGALVLLDGRSTGAMEVAHLPFLARREAEGIVLEGHVALSNPIWRAASEGGTGLAIFQGPQAYIHPGWYETKRATGRVVPTWNYVAIHARGPVEIIRDPSWLIEHVRELTDRNERGRDVPWSVADAPEGFVDTLLRGIVGLRLRVRTLEGAWKMLQHHPEGNRHGVIKGLRSTGGDQARAVASIMADLDHASRTPDPRVDDDR